MLDGLAQKNKQLIGEKQMYNPKKDHPMNKNPRRWAFTRMLMFEIYGRTCRHCGDTKGGMEIDHIERVWEGGKKWCFTNLQVLCHHCHLVKTEKEGNRAPNWDAINATWGEPDWNEW